MPQQRRLDPGIGLDGRIEIGSGLIDSRPNVGVEGADLPGHCLCFDRGLYRTAIGVAQHHDRLGAEHRSAIFQTGDDRRGCDIAGHPRDKDVSETLVEDQLDGHPRIRARQDGGEGLLLFDSLGPQNVEVFGE